MIKKDIKYICKRIIIGFGILFLFSFVDRCNVKAYYNCVAGDRCLTGWLENNNGFSYYDSDSSYQLLYNITNGNSALDIKIYYKENRLYFASSTASEVLNITDNNLNKDSMFITYQSNHYYLNITDNNHIIGPNVFINSNAGNSTGLKIGNFERYINRIDISYNANINTKISLIDYSNTSWVQVSPTNQTNTSWVKFSAFDILSVNNSDILYNGTELSNPLPQIISLQPTKITKNNVIIGYTFKPKFDIFNNDSFSYQYKFSDSLWLNLTENEQLFRINNNGTIYVRIKDRSNNEVVASQTYTISNISKFDTEQDYNITFSGEYRTENYLNNNIYSKSQSIIQEYQIYVDYIPKSSILNYQYQYVKNGDSLDNNNWQNVASSDNGSITYVASDNGTLYARILDSSNNILYSSTFTVNSIGLLAFDSNEKGIDNFLTKISNKINYGGPVSSLFLVPINFLNSLYEPISNSDSCSPLQLGSLLGTNLNLPCVNVKRYLGNNVYNIIDLIMSFFLILGIIKMSVNIYNKFISMKDISS